MPPQHLTCSEVLALVSNAPPLPDNPDRLKRALAAMTATAVDMHTTLFVIAFHESSFDPNMVNPHSSATGLFQILSGTADDIQDRIVTNFMPSGTTIPGLAAGQRLRDHRTNTRSAVFGAYVYLLDRVASANDVVDTGIARYGDGANYATWVRSAIHTIRRVCGLPEDRVTELLTFNRVARDRCAQLKSALDDV